MARIVESGGAQPVVQRMQISPLPNMRSQWTFGLGLFFDPNCGWYCQIAAIGQRAAALRLRLPEDEERVLPKSTLLAYHPGVQGKRLTVGLNKPKTLPDWEAVLTAAGPVIVSGKLGAADWGETLGGVGHFILIVGADAQQGTLDYMDPLQGNAVKTCLYSHMNGRINSGVYVIDDKALEAALNLIHMKPSPSTMEEVYDEL